MNTQEYKEFKASPSEDHLVECLNCGKAVYEDDALPIKNPFGECEGFCCDACWQRECDEWMAYFNANGKPLNGEIKNVEVIDVLDVIEDFQCASGEIRFDCNGKTFSACADLIWMGDCWEFDPNGTITDVEEIDS